MPMTSTQPIPFLTDQLINCVGILFDDWLAKSTAQAFNDQRLYSAGGKVENTVERAYIKPIAFIGSIKGWVVMIEKRDYNDGGKPWPAQVVSP